ncbi:MAG: TIGR04282 family arsenosugar biosynthesis glycosyltransferase [Planctomycetota bacterium]
MKSTLQHQPRRLVVIACKRPVPGRVKTRLARSIGATEAARLYHAFLADTVASASAVPHTELALSFAVGPDLAADQAFMEQLAPQARVWIQAEGDLGARIADIFERAAKEGFGEILLIGSDSPQLSTADYEQALDSLTTEPRVIGPTEDGGFWCVGLRRPEPELFAQVEWSTDRTLEGVLRNASAGRGDLTLLPPAFDVDDDESLEQLRRWIGERGSKSCPNTEACLR